MDWKSESSVVFRLVLDPGEAAAGEFSCGISDVNCATQTPKDSSAPFWPTSAATLQRSWARASFGTGIPNPLLSSWASAWPFCTSWLHEEGGFVLQWMNFGGWRIGDLERLRRWVLTAPLEGFFTHLAGKHTKGMKIHQKTYCWVRSNTEQNLSCIYIAALGLEYLLRVIGCLGIWLCSDKGLYTI